MEKVSRSCNSSKHLTAMLLLALSELRTTAQSTALTARKALLTLLAELYSPFCMSSMSLGWLPGATACSCRLRPAKLWCVLLQYTSRAAAVACCCISLNSASASSSVSWSAPLQCQTKGTSGFVVNSTYISTAYLAVHGLRKS
jgi:hypothetical protein